MKRFSEFPSHFVQYFTSEFVGAEILTPSERALIAKAGEKRTADFSTGRFCARKVLSTLGYPETEILMGNSKEPLWPSDITGSISHSKNLVGAIGCSIDIITSIGLDIETTGEVKKDLWDLLFTESEQSFLGKFNSTELEIYSTLLFSIKESFYKCQYPITRQFLEFKDVEVSCANEIFKIRIQKKLEGNYSNLENTVIQWLNFESMVISLCFLPNSVSI